ncbi:DUF222 domain-containing protein [Diaminobutyricibacter tongyongensis]|uniref:DUF222 domain-containing protein n=1 Tax=Leifsonia tongyongensis TaxID=1268043 RepID=A0A6L9Y1D3_9MICO|nr:HNH endonuclease signature motif containing protein [Diaminobutyricibacter tongyongensis]NEN07501.1 DUF222 domain-containing protein [Diaminobutyricibacter tongyongensis]
MSDHRPHVPTADVRHGDPYGARSREVGDAISELLGDLTGDPSLLSEAELRRRLRIAAELGRRIDAVKATLAAEAAARSRRIDGHGGWAAREGHRNAESLVREICGSNYREAATLVRVGELMATPAGLGSVADGVRDGRIHVDAADGIVRALAPVEAQADMAAFRSAAETLARESESSHADAVTRMAKSVRDTLDRGGVAEREQQLRDKRFLTIGPEIDGMRRLSGLLDPESAAVVVSAVDAVTAPRRGGPRFVDPLQQDRARAIVDDERSHGQLALDSVVEMIRIAGEADPGRVFGTTRPAVRVTIALEDLRAEASGADDGAAHVESSAEPLSAATARRYLCDAGVLPIVFGGRSEILDVGRTERCFTRPQRVALAARDGGCRWPGCDRPPSWTETHHIDPWSSGGRTDLADGILLCRHHHMLLHNNGWSVVRSRGPGEFDLLPPPDVDPLRRVRPMPSRRRHNSGTS